MNKILLQSFKDKLYKLYETKTPKWSYLWEVKRSKIVDSTYIWLVVVPVTAKLFSKVEDTIRVRIDDHVYIFDLVLPFSWRIFFFSALFFVFGNLVALCYANRFIKEYKDYGAYKATGRDYYRLLDYMSDEQRNLETNFLASHLKLEHGAGVQANILSSRQEIEEDDSYRSFWHLHKMLDDEHLRMRFLCSIFYLIGFLLFCWVALINISWVFRQF